MTEPTKKGEEGKPAEEFTKNSKPIGLPVEAETEQIKADVPEKPEEESKYFVVTSSYDEPGRKVVSFKEKEHMLTHVINEVFEAKKGKFVDVFYGKRLPLHSLELSLKVGDIPLKRPLDSACRDGYIEI